MDRRRKSKEGEPEGSLTSLAAGLVLEFCPGDRFSFIVGTEEGAIHRCSSTYAGEYQLTYDGHHLAVYKLQFHPYANDIFVSASADWTVKIWNLTKKAALMCFDLSQAVVDAVWSPFNAGVLVALTAEKLFLFDLSSNRYAPVQSVEPVKGAKCTNLAFNWLEPILLVGDSMGGVLSFKLGKELGEIKFPKGADVKDTQTQLIRKCIQLGSMTS